MIYDNDILGSGSYGKVCKAKWGQLPCAAKLLHNSLSKYSFSRTGYCIVANFQQECEFLSTIQHPNIVQCLGTDPQSQWPALFMELMDESLTTFLRRSTGLLPYHSQLNICYDVALALSYLHSLRPNAIIHRDLSSNNVMLIGEGSRAKVTDFGMSRLVNMFPKQPMLAGMATLGTVAPQLMTQYPGTPVYMPPEASVGNYSTKLDCFSFGVLTIQILTKKIPDPAPNAPNVLFRKCEVERRMNDIVLVDESHPLRPIALNCLEDVDTERLSADELCEKLASLKGRLKYLSSTQGQLQRTQGQLQRTEEELQRTEGELQRTEGELQRTEGELQRTEGELQRTEGELQRTEGELQRTEGELQRTEGELQETQGELHMTQEELRRTQGQLQRIGLILTEQSNY